MKNRTLASILILALLLTFVSASAFADMKGKNVDLGNESGRLEINEAGTYVLTGKLTGCVYVNPGQGEVELILDGADIDGRTGAGIVAVSGDALKVTLPEGSVNRVVDGGTDTQFGAAIFSRVDTIFEGNGALYVTGNNRNGVQAENANLTFNGGSYAIKAPVNGIGANTLTFNDGHFSIRAENSIDPVAKVIMNGGSIEEISPVSGYAVPEGNAPAAPTAEEAPKADLPELPADNFDGQQPPELPSEGFDGQQPPELPSEGFDGQQPQMPGNQTTLTSVDTAGEIVTGTMTNSAASLEADYENATYITVTDDDSQVKITSSGTYVVTGSSSDGNITVKKGTTEVVLVLEDLDLTSTTGATVSVNKEAEVKIIISGNVVLTDNENPEDEYSEDADVADAYDGAALKAKAGSQVYVTGDGTLTINGNAKNGIKSGDDSSLIFDGVTVNINAENDGINGNYDVTLLSGTFTIEAGDDAIHADHILTIGDTDGTGPVIRVTGSEEGLEGTVVNVYGGDISIVSADDAINAANGDGLYEGELDYSFNMMGGRIVINSTGDGVDSNGNVNLIDGSLEIRSGAVGGEAGIDYDGELYISDDFQLNNQSGTAGPDGMPGQMMPGQMGNQGFGDMGNQTPGQMGNQDFGGQGFSMGGNQTAPSAGGPMGGMPGQGW